MPGTSPFRAWWAQHASAAGAAVMAVGIVSVGLNLTGYELLSRVVLAVACVRRWATVFPLGMTAAATLSVAAALAVPGLEGPGEALLWIAVAAWLAVTAGAVADARAGLRTVR
ncbi:hypothetical protein ABZV31_10455 [Streptomyces sp. NPDC005202]|uniref:hypothetical protein n=1 Tax=Streptomyces sp. NPDC005202 TaxID=3157021 RepID=UPI00339F12A1